MDKGYGFVIGWLYGTSIEQRDDGEKIKKLEKLALTHRLDLPHFSCEEPVHIRSLCVYIKPTAFQIPTKKSYRHYRPQQDSDFARKISGKAYMGEVFGFYVYGPKGNASSTTTAKLWRYVDENGWKLPSNNGNRDGDEPWFEALRRTGKLATDRAAWTDHWKLAHNFKLIKKVTYNASDSANQTVDIFDAFAIFFGTTKFHSKRPYPVSSRGC